MSGLDLGLEGYVAPYDRIKSYIIPRNSLGTNLDNYIRNVINAQTVVREARYVDKDYLLDYAGYYSRSFQEVGRLTDRFHFFSKQFSEEYFETTLICGDQEGVQDLQDSYKGFIIIKPFKEIDGNPTHLLGRTLLNIPENCYNESLNDGKCLYIINKVNLFGIPLEIKTLPFQTRDPAVAACATLALWTANNKMNELFQTPLYSPFEITSKARALVENSRNLPPEGLTIKQQLTFIKSIGLDFNLVNVIDHRGKCERDETYRNLYKDFVTTTIRAFLYADIPIIANLALWNPKDPTADSDAHSVVISGYKADPNGKFTKLYVHDDKYGPYCHVSNTSRFMDFSEWNCEWNKKFNNIYIDYLLIPLYPKIRLDYNVVYKTYTELIKVNNDISSKVKPCHHLYFTTINDYKCKLLDKNFAGKMRILKESLPRFVWVIATLEQGSIVREDLYDAVSHYMRKVAEIEFN